MEPPESQVSSMIEPASISACILEAVEQGGDLAHQSEDDQLKCLGNEWPSELLSNVCLQPESAVKVANEKGCDEKRDLEEEHTPEKEIIQSDFLDSKKMKHLQSDNDSTCSNYGNQILFNRFENLPNSVEKHEVVEDVPAVENAHLQAKEVLVRSQNEACQESKTDSSLVRMLWTQIESLALREKEVEQTLSKERIENLVSKVEEEVEFEGMVEDMCLRFRADGEFMDMERRERDWERERREVRLEEEVELLRNKVESLEEEIRIANAEKEYALQKKQVEMHGLICNMQVLSRGDQGQQASGIENVFQTDEEKTLAVVKARHQELPDVGGETVLAALREMLSLAEKKAERDCRALKDSFQDEQQMWIDNEQQLQNQISALEKELNSMQDTLKEKESVISLERERRRHYGLEVDKVLAFWREENSVHNAVCQRLKNIEVFLAEFAQKAMHLKTLFLAGETEAQNALSEILKDLENVGGDKLEIPSPSKGQKLFEWELIERWKSQRDHLEDERDKLEEKLELATRKSRENDERIETLWQENERNFVEKLRNLEAQIGNEDTVWNKTNEAVLEEKGMWELEVSAYKKAWQEEREKVHAMMVERGQWMEEHTQKWAALLDVKEEELCSLRTAQKKLDNSLSTSKKRLLNIKRQLVRHRKGTSKESRSKVQKAYSNFDDNGGLCSDEGDLETSCSTDLLASNERSGAGHGNEEYYFEAEQLAMDISKEIGRLAREIRREQDRLEKERTDVRIGTEQLKDERKELENKVADALTLMEDLREQIKAKEGQMEWERKQMDLILVAKTDEVEHLKKLLSSKEHEIEVNVQKFKDEMNLIQKEVEKERKEREDVMDMHFASRRKLVKEMKEREARWEKEIEATSQEMQELIRDIGEKDEQILRLKNELRDFELEAEQERSMKQEVKGNASWGYKKDVQPRKLKSSRQQDLDSAKTSVGELHSEDLPNENLALINFVSSGVELTALGSTQDCVFRGRRDVDWQDVVGKIAGFDKQIAEAMLAIQSLKEELNAKEKELQRARLDRDSNSKTSWLQERDQTNEAQEKNGVSDVQREFDWGQREQVLLRDNEDLIKLLEAERTDTADAMSILQGAVRELQWALKHYKRKEDDATSVELDRETQSFSIKGELVKVHASHLEELDRFILDLKLKAEEAEKRARAAEVALAVNAVKVAAKGTGTTSALVKVGKDWVDNDRSRYVARGQDDAFPAMTGKNWAGGDLGSQCFQSPMRKQSRIGRQGSDVGSSIRMLEQEQRWSGGSTEHGQLWDVGINSPGMDVSSTSSTSGWMTVRGATDDSFVMQDPYQQGPLTLAVSTPPPRSQRRWLVDAYWLENVRKEQASLRQQLELEKQRVSALKQVEAENRWMEATIMQALEQKKDSDTRVLELERKVAFLEAMITKKGGRERSPSSSPFYRGAKS